VSAQVPGPPGNALWGESLRLLRDPLGHLGRLFEAHGRLIRFQKGRSWRYITSDPEAFHHVFVAKHRNYVKSRRYRHLSSLIGHGLVTTEGEEWQRQRRAVQPQFRVENAPSARPAVQAVIERVLAKWKGAGRVDLAEEMYSLTLDVAGRSFLGVELLKDDREFLDSVLFCLRHVNLRMESPIDLPDFVPTLSRLRFRARVARLDALVMEAIGKRRTEIARGAPSAGPLDALLSARFENGQGFSERQVRDQAMTLLLAGYDTTATALTWTWWLLSRHPQELARVREEAWAGGELPYLEAVIKESMRLYPPAWIVSRQSVEDDEILGYRIPAGSTVNLVPYFSHRDPAWWDEAASFRPERFLGNDDGGARHRLAYAPFAAGPRACLGNHFAILEMKTVISQLLTRAGISFEGPESILRPEPVVVLRPRGSLPARVDVR
jgi:cytochrome P450